MDMSYEAALTRIGEFLDAGREKDAFDLGTEYMEELIEDVDRSSLEKKRLRMYTSN